MRFLGFYDLESSSYANICSNGWITFNTGFNEPITDLPACPNNAAPNALLVPNNLDLDPSAGGSVYCYYHYANPLRVISWIDVPMRNNPNVRTTFQVIFDDRNNDIIFQYGPQVNCDGRYSLVGFESPDGNKGLTYCNHQSGLIYEGLAIKIQNSLWVTDCLRVRKGFLGDTLHARRAPKEIEFTIHVGGLIPGEYQSNIHIFPNDINNPNVVVPVRLNLLDAPLIETSVDSLVKQMLPESQSASTIYVRNWGGNIKLSE